MTEAHTELLTDLIACLETDRESDLHNLRLSKNTQIAYAKGWREFVRWAQLAGVDPNAASGLDVCKFLSSLALCNLSMNTIKIYFSGIKNRLSRGNLLTIEDDRKITSVMRVIVKMKSETPRRVKPLRAEHLEQVLDLCDRKRGLHAVRDAALLALGFSAALRRSELCALEVHNIRQRENGLIVRITSSKTDQAGTGQEIAVPRGARIKPAERLHKWLLLSKISSSYVFQTLSKGGIPSGHKLDDGDVARTVKRYVHLLGLDAAEYSGHSLRAGFVTSAAAKNARYEKIMSVTRHKKIDTLLKYIRDEEQFYDHAGSDFL